jgi:hypothetical protein
MTAGHSGQLIAFSNQECIAFGQAETVIPRLKTFAEASPEKDLLVLDAVTSRNVELDLRLSAAQVLTDFQTARLTEDSASAVGLNQADSKSGPESDQEPGQGQNHEVQQKRTRGRPRLGVVSREVTLLPRHWEWLASQPGGASVALRKLVEAARKDRRETDRLRAARDATYRFMTVLAGNEPAYEEAVRALFAEDLQRLTSLSRQWPRDVAEHAIRLASGAVEIAS